MSNLRSLRAGIILRTLILWERPSDPTKSESSFLSDVGVSEKDHHEDKSNLSAPRFKGYDLEAERRHRASER